MIKRNKFNLGSQINLTGDPGVLYPVDWWDVIPGDTFQARSAVLLRSTPLLAPIMHSLHVRLHWFFVPYRQIWDDADDFFTGGPDGTSLPTHPYIALGSVTESSLYHYLGLPAETFGATINCNALPLRAYSRIWNEWYADQDLCTARVIDTTSGQDTTTDVTLANAMWPKSYLNTSRPWEQKGTAITIPLEGEAPIFGDNMDFDDAADSGNYAQIRNAQGSSAVLKRIAASAGPVYGLSSSDGTGELKADLSEASGLDLNELRLSIGLQQFMEELARGGSRYAEYLRTQFGVRGSDRRLENPEYIAGGRTVMQFSEVLSTGGADNGANSSVGSLRGHGIGAMRSNRFRKFFDEHGILMSLISILPTEIFQNAVPRKWTRTTKEEYYQKQLAHIGEQIVKNQEVYAPHGTPSGTFGYAPRYDELRSQYSRIAGEFASTLQHWHMARDFGSNPALNQTFVECTPTNRNWASTGTHKFLIDCINNVAARRPIPKYGTPGLRRI